MWTIPDQLSTSQFVPDMKELGLDCEEFGEMSEKSLTWRSKHSLKRTWCQRWNRVTYIRLLSIRMLKPSHFESFVERWISSLPDSLVHRFPRLEDENQQMIRDIYTHISVKESHSANQLTLFSKTLKESSQVKPQTKNRYSNMSSETWKEEVIAQRGEYSQRLKLVRPINENESLSWPTATVSDVRDGKYLRERTKQWMADGKVKGIILNQATENEECQELYKKRAMWPTATISDPEGGSQKDRIEMTESGFKLRKKNKPEVTYGAKLRDAVEYHEDKNWPTPQVTDSTRGDQIRKRDELSEKAKKGGCKNLREDVANWSTPTATERSGINPKTGRGEGLSKEAKRWATPNTMDYLPPKEGEAQKRIFNTHRKGRKAPCNLREQINPKSWPQKDGRQDRDSSKKSGKSQGRLNPNWVEQLMSLPFVGWTQLPTEWID